MSDLHLTTDDKPTQGKSLAPLIAAFTVIVLLTIILINTDAGKNKEAAVPTQEHQSGINLAGNSKNSPPQPAETIPEDSNLMNVDAALARVKRLLAKNKVDQAEEKLRTILVFAPDNAQALTLFGGILYYSGREKEAEAIFRRQIKLNPKDHLAYNRLGSALAKQKRYQEAINCVAVAVGLNPNSGEAQVNLAGLYSLVNDRQAALKHFREAAKLLGSAILPLSHDSSFDNIRSTPEFQTIISETLAKQAAEKSAANSSSDTKPNSKPSGGGER